MAANVKFYTLSDFPSANKVGSFLHLKNKVGDNQVGLYFCDVNGWHYLTNVEQNTSNDVLSAKEFDGVVYFFNTSTPLSTKPTSTSQYLFSVDLSLLDCGEYDSSIKRHVQHLRTQSVGYCRTRKTDIPDGESVTRVESIPTTITSSSPKYIQVTTNNWYYSLCGKQPQPSSLKDGEIAVSYAKGYERLFIKNSNNEIVEFAPTDHRKNIVTNATFVNPELEPNENVCKWVLDYEDLSDAGINPMGAVVFVREVSTGKQLIPDVVFDDTNRKVKILLYATGVVVEKTYRAIVMGSNYNN